MDALDNVLLEMDLNFVGNAQHKITVADLVSDKNAVLLDVRTEEEALTVTLGFSCHLHSVHLPLHRLPLEYSTVPSRATVGIFCPHSVRAAVAYTYLRSKGYKNVFVLEGGYAALLEEARPGRVLAAINGK
jgi:rhodanese-related sulfurtransferase